MIRMDDWELTTPVVFIIFNRPDTTAQVFKEIARAKPKQLFIIADGPRENHPSDRESCATTRAIVEKVDWDCEIATNYSELNLGCKKRVSSGIDWVFNKSERAIIIEDDCVPDPTFFRFCDELLHTYQDDKRIMMVTGNNYNAHVWNQRTRYSYYFSRYAHVAAWASWRRAWQYYDIDMKLWPSIRDGKWLEDILGKGAHTQRWRKSFELMYKGLVDTWDQQWLFACWIQNGLTIIPRTNLITNIGFDANATHTTDANSPLSNLQTIAMEFPLQHPPFVIRDSQADDFSERRLYSPTLRDLTLRGISKFKRLIYPYFRR